jgi:hypothetical protein
LGQLIGPFFKGQTAQEEFFLDITKEQISNLHSTRSLKSQIVVMPNLNFRVPNTKQTAHSATFGQKTFSRKEKSLSPARIRTPIHEPVVCYTDYAILVLWLNQTFLICTGRCLV